MIRAIGMSRLGASPGPQRATCPGLAPKRLIGISTGDSVEINDEPIGYFITWTVYGTFLHGDQRGWRQRGGQNLPRPRLERWQRDRLRHDVILLTKEHRSIVKTRIVEHCKHRGWKLWVANPRTNHVHVVVTAAGYAGAKVRDQLKANATGALRQHDEVFVGRPVWTTKGDVSFLNSDDDLESAVVYAGEAQDRMDRGK